MIETCGRTQFAPTKDKAPNIILLEACLFHISLIYYHQTVKNAVAIGELELPIVTGEYTTL